MILLKYPYPFHHPPIPPLLLHHAHGGDHRHQVTLMFSRINESDFAYSLLKSFSNLSSSHGTSKISFLILKAHIFPINTSFRLSSVCVNFYHHFPIDTISPLRMAPSILVTAWPVFE